MVKDEKLPTLNTGSKILCFDVESNGLHGDPFAVGALVIDGLGEIHDQFEARSQIDGAIDPWVEQNVLTVIIDLPVTHDSYRNIRDDFWAWFINAQSKADYVLVMNGYPVEYRFLMQCQADDMDVRYWQHPFPILDLTSMMVMKGHSQSTKNKFMAEVAKAHGLSKHHPMDDAKMTALTAFNIL